MQTSARVQKSLAEWCWPSLRIAGCSKICWPYIDLFERKIASWNSCDHGEVAFVSAIVTGKRFNAWLSKLKGKAQGYEFRIPKPQPRINSERYTSRLSFRQLYLLPYPFTLFSVEFEDRNDGERRSNFTPLVKDGPPSFPNFGTAVYRLLYDLDRPRGTDIPHNQIMIRMSHPEAWIEEVAVEREAVTVGVTGTKVEGTRLTVGGPSGVLVTCAGRGRLSTRARLRLRRSRSRISRSRIITVTTAFAVEQLR